MEDELIKSALSQHGKVGEIKNSDSIQNDVKIENSTTPDLKESSLKEDIDSEKTEEAKSIDKKPDVKEIPQKTFEELYKEKFGFDFSDEHIEKVKSEPKQYEFKSDFAKKIEEYVEQGGSHKDYIDTQSTDFGDETDTNWGELYPKEHLFLQKKMQNPDWTDEMIETELDIEYGFGDWHDNEDDYADGKEPKEITFKKQKFLLEAKKAKAANIKHQKEWAVPEKQDNTSATNQKQKEFVESWNKSVESYLKDYKKETIKVGNDDSFDFEVSDKRVESAMKTIATNPTQFVLNRYLDEKGNTLYDKMRKEMYILENFENIVKDIFDNARAKGTADGIKEQKNATPFDKTGQHKISNNDSAKSIRAVADKLGLNN